MNLEERIPQAPPIIKPIEDNASRPVWSVMIPVYNCFPYIKVAVESVLAQDLGPERMQIEVVDDCSTDGDVEALVRELGKGRVSYYRQPYNRGSLRNFETCLNRARGHYIHLLHGDDRVKVGFYKALTGLFERFPEVGAAFTGWSYINDEGKLTRHFNKEADAPCILNNWLHKLAERQRLQYVAMAVKREVYERLGSFYGVIYGEDWEMWARIARHYPTAYTPELLAEYREHGDHSISKNSFLSGRNIREISWIIDTISGYLPAEDRLRINRAAKKHYVHWALGYTRNLWHLTKDRTIVWTQLKEISKVYMDTKLAVSISKLLARICLEPVRQGVVKAKHKMNGTSVIRE